MKLELLEAEIFNLDKNQGTSQSISHEYINYLKL